MYVAVLSCMLYFVQAAKTKTQDKDAFHDGDHKPLWPLNHSDILTFLLASVGLIIASGGGIGRFAWMDGCVFLCMYGWTDVGARCLGIH